MILPEDPSRHRDFICPCGKGYFSYAALFTHVKQKHQGKVRSPTLSLPDRSSSPNHRTSAAGPRSPLPAAPPDAAARIRCRPAGARRRLGTI